MATYDEDEDDLDFEDLQEISLFSPRPDTPGDGIKPATHVQIKKEALDSAQRHYHRDRIEEAQGLHNVNSARLVLERLPLQGNTQNDQQGKTSKAIRSPETARVVLERLQQGIGQNVHLQRTQEIRSPETARVVLERLPGHIQQGIGQNVHPQRTQEIRSPETARVVLERLPDHTQQGIGQNVHQQSIHETRSPQKISDSARVVLEKLPIHQVIERTDHREKTTKAKGQQKTLDSSPLSPKTTRQNDPQEKTKGAKGSKKITDCFSPSRKAARQTDLQEKTKGIKSPQKKSDSLISPSKTTKKNDRQQNAKDGSTPQKIAESSSSPPKTKKRKDSQKKTTEVSAPKLITEYFSLSLRATAKPKDHQQKTNETIGSQSPSDFTAIKKPNKRPRTLCSVPLLNLNVITRKDGRVECLTCKFVSKSVVEIEQHSEQCARKQTRKRPATNKSLFTNTPRPRPNPGSATAAPSWLGLCHDPASATASSALTDDVAVPLDVEIKEETDALPPLAIQPENAGQSTAGVQFVMHSAEGVINLPQHVAYAFQAACTQCGKQFMSAAEHKDHVAVCWGKGDAGSPNKKDKDAQKMPDSSPSPKGGRKSPRTRAQSEHQCTLCQEKFGTQSELRNHVTANHMEIDIDEPLMEEIPDHTQDQESQGLAGATPGANLKRRLKDKLQLKS